MKKLTCLFGVMLCSVFFTSCSSDEIPEEVTPQSEISFYDLMRVGEGKFFYCPGHHEMTYLAKKNNGWKEAKLDVPKNKYTDQELREGVFDVNLDREYFMLFPYGQWMHPQYFWFYGGKVYSNYSEMTFTDVGYEYADFKYSDIEPFFDYMATQVERSDDIFKSDYWISMLNTLEVEEGNVLKMSYSEHPLRTYLGADYKYVLEEADETKLVIRVEFKENRYGCDAVRMTYKSISQRPQCYLNFDSKEEAAAYIKAFLEEHKQ